MEEIVKKLWRGKNDKMSSVSVGNRSDNSFTRNNKTRNSSADPENTNDIKCRCGLPAKSLIVSKPGPNTGRPFYGCSKPREQSCNFFQWADEPSTDSGRQSEQGRSASYSLTPFLPGNGSGRKRSSTTHSDEPKQRKPPKCGFCGQIGHRKTKCPERLNDF